MIGLSYYLVIMLWLYLRKAEGEQISIYFFKLTEYHFRKPEIINFHENTYRTNWKHSPQS
jgi:hypothetical protein